MKRYLLIIGVLFSCLSLRAQSVNYTCRYWFDQNFGQATTATFSSSTWHSEIDVGTLSDGLHFLHIHVMDTSMKWTAPQSYLFYKAAALENGTPNCIYHCWFDEDFANKTSDELGNGHLLLDVNNLEDGLHTVYVMVEGDALTSTQSYIFMKMAVETPSAEIQYHFWFDHDYNNVQSGLLGSGIFELEVEDLPTGLHMLNVQLDNGVLDAPRSYLFYKQPMGDHGIARWEYCLNNDWENRYTTILSPVLDTLDVVTLLTVGHPSIISSCFHFHPNGDEPYINAKNEITFRFWDNDYRFFDKSAFFVDEQIQQEIVAGVFERNTTETFASPRDNQIKWFKLDAVIGDSLAFMANKACTMQLFAPSGEEVYSATASESMVFGGCHAWEDGTYYLSVHDVTGSGETIEVTYQYMEKYVVLDYTPNEIGNTWGSFEFGVLGNGFNKLTNVILNNDSENWMMDTIMYFDISEATIQFAMDSTKLNGIYDVILCFEDQIGELDTLVLPDAIHVDEAKFGTIDIDYNYQFNTTSPHLIALTVQNNGNVEYQGIPLLFAYTNVNNVEIDLYDDWILVQEDYFENGGTCVYYENNLFDQSIAGNCIPLIIPKLGPYETRKITLIVDAANGTSFDFYAWGGVPWSVKTEEAYDADDYYCQTHPEYQGWNGNYVWNNGDSGSSYGGGSSGGAHYTVGSNNAKSGGGNGAASAVFSKSCSGIPDPCKLFGISDFCSRIMKKGRYLKKKLNPQNSELHNKKIDGATKNKLGAGTGFLAYVKGLHVPGSLLSDVMIGKGFSANSIGSCPNPSNSRPNIPRPIDPNDIFGYLSESGSHYMPQEIQNLHYEIEFENDTTLATAAAHTIIVRDTLDANRFDLNSLAAHSVTIGDKRLELNGEQTFAKTLDMRPELYVIAQIEQDYDTATGVIQWTISSLDPMTMEPTDNPFQGVLPVNYYGDGVGFIDYSVNLKQMFADGTEISNRAGIIFDTEDMIMTPTWTNIVDAVKPTSTIADVTQMADTLNFIFSSEDNRSGIWYHTLYFRNESTEMEWKVKKSQILENNYKMNLEDLQMTEYFVLATDSAGNREDKEFLAEFIYSQDNVILQNNTLVQGWNWWSTYVEQSTMDGLITVENSLGNNGLTIKSQNEFTTNYYENMGYDYWYGGLEAIDNEHGYMINTNDQCNVRMLGTPAQPEEHPIAIGANWNWIGYPVGQQQLLATSISNTFQPESEDIMKSQSGFATYYPGYGWYPDDFVMTPGEGYLYKSNSTANKTLTYVLSGRHSYTEKQKEIHQWKPAIHKYADNISVIAVLDMNGYEIRENIEVGAFVNGECRGSAILKYFEPTDRYYAMLNIAGEEDDVVSFEIQGSNSETLITFHKNDVIGSLDAPLPIEFGFLGNDVSDLTLYPNPVEHDANFSIDIPAWEKVSDVTITNVLGLVIRKESTNGINMNGIHEPGIYIVKITCKTGNVYQNVLIVK